MCGIAGIFLRSGHTQGLETGEQVKGLVSSMLTRIQHRGRDTASSSEYGTVSIGCCRLPIVDRDNGHQPVSNEDESVVAVFNGEIYNHEELRKNLTKHGHRLQTKCDSELIPHLLEQYRGNIENIHDSLYGMYAIAIYDVAKRECILMRDHIGKKPLYLLESAEVIAFASEMKAFGIQPEDKKPFGESSVIHEVKPGETVIISDRGIERFSSVPKWRESIADVISDMGIATGSLYKCLEQSVQRRLPLKADLPLAVLCSGGIDSVIIAWLAKQLGAKVTAYVIGTHDSIDVHAATETCRLLNIKLETVIIDEDALISVVGDVVYHTESFEPNIVRNSLISYLLFKRIQKDGYRVALCGEGADELFFGYADFEEKSNKQELMGKLLDDLYQTQLLRVDRTSMAFNVEVRVPYLDRDVIQLACKLASELKETRIYGLWQGKAVLRQAFRNELPWEAITRSKATFSYGAGFGDVSMVGQDTIEDYAKRVLGDEERRLKNAYQHIDLSTSERALYLYYFEKFYQIPAHYAPPTVATKEMRHRDNG